MLSSRLRAPSHNELCCVWVSPSVQREFKRWGLVEKSREAQGSEERIAINEAKLPIAMKYPRIRSARSSGGFWSGTRGPASRFTFAAQKSHRSFCSACGACLGFQPGRASPPSISGIYLASVTQVPRRQGARDGVRPHSLRTGRTGPREQVVSPGRWRRGDGVSPGLPGSPEMAPRAGESGAAALGLPRCAQRV